MKYVLLLVTSFLISTSNAQELDSLINNWHKAAAKADYNAFFGLMDKSFVYLGTAPGERWDKDAFSAFAKPFFDKGRAWDFKPSNRVWMYSENKKMAWFDEDLDTWMRGCRGSGIMVKKKGEWKLVYYNLTVLIENEKVQPFIKLRDEPLEPKK